MRTAYREHLDSFSHDLIIMCDIVHKSLKLASEALIDSELHAAEEAMSLREELDEVRNRCEERAVLLLALENPMAKDLRQVVSSIYIVEDLHRMGRLAQHVASAARRRHPENVVPAEYIGYFEELARLNDDMIRMLREILVTPDPDTALRMASEDDAVDDINHYLLSILTNREWKASVREAVETAQMTRYYERFADHCVSVAGRIIYLSTGLAPEAYMAKLSEEERDKEFESRMAELERQFRH
ncbi:PhoU family transcriptional regulator [Corynebacterium sp. HMSC071F07]|uniref:Phosphate-specific transport system accessory protein PhoU n=1 Tax=Corynebacterium simulans TaxID=146827 RepID=A0ABR5V7B2_9CORY|nr:MULTISPECIES: phosphate signaling complex protein PhoU [Corynebacterium]KXU17426.1 phosphate transport system regulatory protein PhoU [Corynebacterium simulans]OFL99017.1 PhoU family transcriptional regulator [Corynebacterium sp. HMSC071F07]